MSYHSHAELQYLVNFWWCLIAVTAHCFGSNAHGVRLVFAVLLNLVTQWIASNCNSKAVFQLGWHNWRPKHTSHHCSLNMTQNIFSEILKSLIFSILEETVYGNSCPGKWTRVRQTSHAANPFIERPHRGWWTGTSCRMCCSKGIVMRWVWFKSCKLVGRLTSEQCYQMYDSILWQRRQNNILELSNYRCLCAWEWIYESIISTCSFVVG